MKEIKLHFSYNLKKNGSYYIWEKLLKPNGKTQESDFAYIVACIITS